MMRLTKRALSAFLAFVMVFTMLPLQSWAADTVQDSSNNAVNFGDMVVPNSVEDPEEKKVDTYQFYNDDTLVSTQYVMSGDQVYAPASPEIDGYKFTGWKDASGNFFTAGAVKTATGATYTYKAQFEQVYYVFFLNKEGAVCATKEGTTGTSVTTDVTFPVGTDEGISGWYYNAELTEPTNGSVTIKSSNITLYPKVETGHWITFDSAGGTYVEPAFVAPGANTVEPAKPEREGFDFLGWYDGDTEYIFDNTLSESVTLTAKWQGRQVEYKVFYWKENADNDEYSLDKMETMQDTAGEETEAGAYYNAGDGFHLSDDPDKQLVQKTIEGDGSTIVNVYYDRNVYTIKFYTRNAQGQVICGKQEHQHHGGWNSCYDWWGNLTCGKEEHTHTDACYSDAILATITAKYEAFIGDKWPTNDVGGNNWSTNRDGSSPWQANIQTMPLNGDNFYVPSSGSGSKRSTATYYVEVLDGEDGIGVSSSRLRFKVHHSDTINYSDLTVSEEDRYPLVGFTLITGSPSSRVGDTYNGAKFYYTRNDYTLTFVNLGSSSSETVQYQADISGYGEEPDRPAGIPSNYEFQGWYLDQAFQTKYDFAGKTMPAQNITVYAKWAAPEVTATVHLTMDGNGESKVLAVPYGTKIDESSLTEVTLPADSIWHGWATKNGDVYTPFNFDTVITKDIELYPYYTSKKAFTVVYNVNGSSGEVTDGRTYKDRAYADVKYANGVAAPADKVFLGWNTASDGSGHMYQPGDKLLIDSKNANAENQITLYAQWGDKAGKAKLVYNANNGSDLTADGGTHPNNSTVQLESAESLGFTRDGYRFLGWAADPEATEPTYQAGTSYIVNNKNTSDGVNTLYAVWERAEVTVNYVATEGGTVEPSSEKVLVGQNAKGSTATAAEGYYFVNWTNAQGDVVSTKATFGPKNVTADATYTAHFEKQTAITIVAKSFSKVYDGKRLEVPEGNWYMESPELLPAGYQLSVTLQPVTKDIINVGDSGTNEIQRVVITNDKGEDVTHQFAITTRSGDLSITPKAVKVKANDAGKIFGASDPVLTATVTGMLNGDTVAYELKREAGEDVGTYAITATGDAEQGNYIVSYEPGDFTIGQATLTDEKANAKGFNVPYDGQTHTITVTNTEGATVTYTVNGVETSASALNVADSQAKVTVTFTHPNYKTKTVTVEKVITPKTVKVKANDAGKIFGASEPVLTATVTGTLNNDTVAYELKREAGEDVGTYAITATGDAEQGNYIVSYEPGVFTIGQATLTAEQADAKGFNMPYDGQSHTITVTNTVGAKVTYTVNGVETSASALNVADSQAKVTVTFTHPNYKTKTVIVEKVITPRDVTITVANASKVYGAADPAFTGTVEGLIRKKDLGEIQYYRTNNAQDVGTYSGVLDARYTTNTNYTVSVEKADFTITPKPITLTAKSVDISYGDPIPALWIKEDLNTLLVPGDTITFQLDTKPMMDSQNNPLVGTYPIEFVGKEEEQGNYLITFVDGTLTVKAPEGYPHVVKTHTGEPLFPGDEVQFAITVKNIYNETAAVTITELPEVTFDDVTGVKLAPGETKTFYATYKVTEEDILAGSFTNVATYTLTVGQNRITGTAEDTVPLNANPKMTVDKVITSKDGDGNGKYDLNETIRYQITIRNDGNVTLTNVIVKDFFGMVEDSSFVDITDQLNAAPDFDGTLLPKESVTFTYDYQVKEADLGKTVSNQATATASYRVSDQDDPNAPSGMLTGEKTVTCLTEEPNPSLQVHKSVDNEKEVYKVDDVINYTITVTNDGNVTMENVNVEDVLVDADGKEVWQIDLGEAATFTLKPGESETIHCSYTVREEDLGKTLVNTATATAENPVDPDKPVTDDDETDGEKVEDPNPSVDLDKRITNQQATYKVGQTITYQIVVKNNGNTTLHDLVLTDDLINSDGTVTFTDLGGGTLSGGEAHLASLAPGAQWTVTCRYVVRAADESQSIANYAEVISHDPQTGEPDAVADDTTEQVEVEARYTLTIRYENQARQQIHGSYVTRLSAGDQYSVTSPAVAGYYLTENAKVISGTMPAEDRTIVVIYAAVPGPDGGDEDDETTEATEATEATEEPPVDPGAYTEDPDDYTLTPITDEETPLANLDEEHTCCILHFLVMLAAMVVLGFYTGSKKKHQARIFELKRTLAKEQDLPEQDDPEHP